VDTSLRIFSGNLQDLALLLAGSTYADPASLIADPATLLVTMSACRLARRHGFPCTHSSHCHGALATVCK
jgi:hypothetical protein